MQSTPHGRVPVVEGDDDSRDTLAFLLKMEGYAVACATNGQEALHYLESAPCLILLDLMMSVMDGQEFRRRQKQKNGLSSIPVVVVSGVGNVEEKAASVDANDYLLKPVELGTLLKKVERFCC